MVLQTSLPICLNHQTRSLTIKRWTFDCIHRKTAYIQITSTEYQYAFAIDTRMANYNNAKVNFHSNKHQQARVHYIETLSRFQCLNGIINLNDSPF